MRVTKQYRLLLDFLISAREEKGLSQRALAKKLKKAPTYVSKYERGSDGSTWLSFLK